MKAKLTFGERWFLFWGFPYLMNVKTGEVHFLPKKTAQCGIDNMARHNKMYLTRAGFKRMMAKTKLVKNINGCCWCNKNYDLE